jgi:hypothetical protein
MATLIAFVLNLTIEHLSRKRHEAMIDEIQVSVLTAALKRRLPEAIFKELEESVLRADVYRENDKVWYTLSRLVRDGKEHPTAVCLDAHSRYEIVNATDRALEIPLGLQIGVSAEHPNECGIDEMQIDDKPIDLKDKITRVDRWITLRHTKQIQPNGRLKVEFSYRQVQYHDSFEAVCNVVGTTALEVEVLVPRQDFDVHAISLHPKDAVQGDEHDGKLRFAWRLPGAALPGQGILLIWKKKDFRDVVPVQETNSA